MHFPTEARNTHATLGAVVKQPFLFLPASRSPHSCGGFRLNTAQRLLVEQHRIRGRVGGGGAASTTPEHAPSAQVRATGMNIILPQLFWWRLGVGG